MPRNAKNSGFTLVELIIVLVIVGILAAILVPSMIGYIQDARNQQVLLYANNVFKAAQSSLMESYAEYPFEKYYGGASSKNKIQFEGSSDLIPCGFLTNATFARVQESPEKTAAQNAFSQSDPNSDAAKAGRAQYEMAQNIIKYLGGEGAVEKAGNGKFSFLKTRISGGKYGVYLTPWITNGDNIGYPDKKVPVENIKGNSTSIIIAWDGAGQIIYFSFAYHQAEVVYSPKAGIEQMTIYNSGEVLRGVASAS